MSYQKTKRIQSPIKGKIYSMIKQDNQNQNLSMFNSGLTMKRKPIFRDNYQKPYRGHMSSLSPSRRKIFNHQQKSNKNSQQSHFTKVFQTNQLQLNFGDDLYNNLSSSESSDSVSSSSIESNQGLQQVKRKLFPTTPIKKIVHHDSQQLQEGRDFLTNSWKKLHLIQSDQPLKTNLQMKKSHVQKTVVKSNSNTPIKSFDQTITNKKIQQSSYKVCLDFDMTLKYQNLNNNQNFNLQDKKVMPKKDLAKQIREIHQKLTTNNRAHIKTNDFSECLKKENQFLKKQNERLQKRFLQFI